MKKAYHKKVIETANVVIPGSFSKVEKTVTHLQRLRDQSKSIEEQYKIQLQIIKQFELLDKMSDNLQYVSSKRILNEAAQRYIGRSYSAMLAAAKQRGLSRKRATAEAYYQEGRELQRRGPASYQEAIQYLEKAMSYIPAYADSKTQIASMYYDQALIQMRSRDRESNKQAVLLFKKAKKYAIDYRDIAELYPIAKERATLRVAILPFDNRSGKPFFGAIGEFQSDQIMSSILGDVKASEFVEIITRDQLAILMEEHNLAMSGIVDEQSATNLGQVLGIHQILTGKITQIIINQPQPMYKTYRETKKIQVDSDGDYVSPGAQLAVGLLGLALQASSSDMPSYYDRQAIADVVRYTKYASAKVGCAYNLIDVESGRVLKTGVFSHQDEFNSVWATYTGNHYARYALSSNSKSLCKKSEQVTPSPEDMASNCAEVIAHHISRDIIQYLR